MTRTARETGTEGGEFLMKTLNVRTLETLKTTAAAYGHCPIIRV
jgi:hypothetical protein